MNKNQIKDGKNESRSRDGDEAQLTVKGTDTFWVCIDVIESSDIGGRICLNKYHQMLSFATICHFFIGYHSN